MSAPQPTEEQIRARAYQVYLARGAQPGHERDDWLQAEFELRQMPAVQVYETAPSKDRKSKPT